ncbi:MAG: chromosome segregation protein SMC [Myxococcaceae bacterium]|nr:chromosome segregation protein SMC [Myxococcaceae bacterium]
MRIKRLDICGFKSFMDRSVLSFGDGVTGVVGPNGCGKSNVVDAIRWVMGEQSAKNLRGRGMEDVIFNGSESQAPLSMAEVTMTMQVEPEDVLPPTMAGLPEVSVTRRLFRSGESEYELNKTKCRLLDITELFLGTGVGTRAYSIIEQGRVGQIVSSRPEDRRTFIEEAAGVTRYKARKKAAERKMEHAANNLLRVNDVVAELKVRHDSLDRQAKKAEKYQRLKAEMRRIELHAASHRWLELNALRKVVDARLSKLGDDERAAFEAVQAKEAAIAAARDGLEQAAAGIEALAGEVHALEGQTKLDASNLEHWSRDQAATRARVTALEAELVELAQGREAATVEQASKAAEADALEIAGKEDDVAAQVLAEELRRASELQAQVHERLGRDRNELLDSSKRVANLESSSTAFEQRKADAEAASARLLGELQGLTEERTVVEQGKAEVLARVGQARAAHAELQARRGEEESSLERAREAFAENEIQVICLREELADKRSRLHSLEDIQKNYEGYDRGVRAVMHQAGDDPSAQGIVGLLSDLLSAPPTLEKALEAVLAERMQHVVVQSPKVAWEWIEKLGQRGEGRATFIPLGPDNVSVHPERSPDEVGAESKGAEESAPAVEVEAAPVVEGGVTEVPLASPPQPPPAPTLPVAALAVVHPTRAEAKALIDVLLDGVQFVADLAAAKEASAQNPHHTFVTLAGEVIRPGGVATGGVLEGAGVGALHKRREIEALREEVLGIEGRYNEIVTKHYALQKQMGHTEGVLKGLSRHAHAEELSLASYEKDLSAAAASLAKLDERVTAVRHELEAAAQGLEALAREGDAARDELLHAEADRSAREERVRLLSSEIESLEVRARELFEQQTALKVKVASTSERVEAAKSAATAAAARIVDLAARNERSAVSLDEAKQHLVGLDERIATVTAEGEARKAELAAKQEALGQRRTEHTAAVQSVREQETELKALRTQADEHTQGLSQLSIQEREASIELQHLEQQVLERWQIPIGHAVGEFHFLKQLDEVGQKQLKELRGQVERMGEVNVAAIDELKEVAERYAFLEKQRLDLESSIEQLKAAIKKIDATSRERFSQTFDAVNDRFQKIFPRLFGGGRASIVLTEEAPGMEAGVEIVAQPPGKKLQSVQLLSGGEKALTAVSMIFAIFLIKPTPFCLLDEVDAPLDEGNVGRYNDMVKEMSKQSQFILITHNKRTMEIVDNIYGVTMEEPGISKLVTVKIREAVAANDDKVVA